MQEAGRLITDTITWHLERSVRSMSTSNADRARATPTSRLRHDQEDPMSGASATAYQEPFRIPAVLSLRSCPPRPSPRTCAVVMDGNGRWANRRGLPRTAGHEAGEAALLDVVAGALQIGVTHLSAYAFSTENWKRSPEEVRFLMGFSRSVLRRQRDTLNSWGVRIVWVGREQRLWGQRDQGAA